MDPPPAANRHSDVFIPKLVQTTNFKDSPDQTACPGCGQEFRAKMHLNNKRKKMIPCIEFYQHCLKRCPQYLSLNVHKHCACCNKLFMRESNFVYHLRSYKKCKLHYTVASAAAAGSVAMDTGYDSPGSDCQSVTSSTRPESEDDAEEDAVSYKCRHCTRIRSSPLLTEYRQNISAEQIVHMVNCPTYQASGQVQNCAKCDLKFIDSKSFDFHTSFVCPRINQSIL